MGVGRRSLGKSRIEALSDGVFSIAMTLLVLKLEVPEVMHHSSNQAMLQQLLALTPAFLTYAVTFLIAGGFWYVHHLTFHLIRSVDGLLVWINLLFLMFVALLPFSAGLMSHLLVHPVSQLFYYGNQLAIAALLSVHWQYARSRNLVGDSRETWGLTQITSAATAGFAACLIIAIFLPGYSWMPLPFIVCGWLIVSLLKKRRHSRPFDNI
jgi:uncharacterized membrane protein